MAVDFPLKKETGLLENFKENLRVLSLALSDFKIMEFFWMGVALTSPFFAVDFLRLNMGVFHLAYPMFGLILILYFGAIIFFSTQGKAISFRYLKDLKLLGFLSAALSILAFLSLLQSVDLILGIKEFTKLLTGLIAFWLTLTFFPRNPKFIRIFFILVFIYWTLMLLRLLYQYAIVFHLSYLSIGLQDADRRGKSVLAANILFFFYYSFFYFWFGTKKKFLFLIPVLIATLSLIYTGARMGWICVAISFFYTIHYIRKRNRKLGTKLAKQIILGTLIVTVLGVLVLSRFIDLFEITTRFVSIYNPSGISQEHAYLGRNSYNVRGDTLLQAWNGFLTSPVVGVGIANTLEYVERLTHNDFMTVLLELGVIGEVLFIWIIALIWRRIFIKENKRIQSGNAPPWYALAGRANALSVLLSIIFYNCYTTVYFWFYLALSMVMIDVARKNETTYSQ